MRRRTPDVTHRSPSPPLARGLGWALLGCALTLPAEAQVTGYVELQASRAERDAQLVSLPPLAERSDFWRSRGRLEWRQRLWPNLTLRLGAFAEKTVNDLTSPFGGAETEVRRLQPFFDLRLRSDEHLAEVLYDRAEERNDFGGPARQVLLRDSWSATYGWFPRRALPQLQLQYLHTDQRDRDRLLADRTEERWLLTTEYTPHDTLYLRYRASLERIDNRFSGAESDSLAHNVRVRFDDAWWERRLTLAADYNVTWRETERRGSGQGEIEVPVPAAAGLSALDATPDRDPLAPNPALADENLVAATGIDLGLPAPGDDDPRNFGLDFAIERDVDTLRVWVDRALPPEIVDAFSWQVWTSTDNDLWILHAALPVAPFGPFENRFELRIPDLFARYVKVVVAPLAPSDPFASSWPDILVTELEAVLRVPAGEFEDTRQETSQLGTAAARLRLLDDVALYYELTGFVARSDSDASGTTRSYVSNGVSLLHPLGPHWSIAARVAREDGRERGGDREAWIGSASLTAAPVATLRHNLVLSAKDETVAGLENDVLSVFLYSTAELYRGVSLTFGAGRSRTRRPEGTETYSQQLDFSATLVPHETTTVVLLLRDADDEIEPLAPGATIEQHHRAAEASVAWRPYDAVYFFGSWRVEDRSREPHRVLDTYSVNWAPFRDGALHVNLAYDALSRSDDDTVQRGFTPSLRWNFSPRAWFDLSYQELRDDSVRGRIDSEILSGTLRLLF